MSTLYRPKARASADIAPDALRIKLVPAGLRADQGIFAPGRHDDTVIAAALAWRGARFTSSSLLAFASEFKPLPLYGMLPIEMGRLGVWGGGCAYGRVAGAVNYPADTVESIDYPKEFAVDIKGLNEEGRDLWNRKASFWDELHGDDGNDFHRTLIEPGVLQLLALRAGESVLDVGCGNGALARRLAALGANVTAIDFSEKLIELARRRSAAHDGIINYIECDATDEKALLQLGAGRFDAVTCAMTLMDIPTTAPLFNAASRLLSKLGRFVFSTMHPAFNSNNPIFIHEKEDRDGTVVDRFSVKLSHYLEMPPVKGAGAPGEPTPHYYYHRPLSKLLGTAFAAGFVLDGLLEPAFTSEDFPEGEQLSWRKYAQIPPVLSARLRLA
ncbi:MAG: class I SAM-dependent methyltransferase [Chloroflexi bacterium]|nr:class I SAM-dependent methyltransferase [Chloroflexota bacterium]